MTSQHEPTPHLRLELLSQAQYLCCVRELMISVTGRLGFDNLTASKIALAVDEALANVICHGYERATDGRIWLSVSPIAGAGANRGVRIVIEDEARQVEPACIKGRDLEEIRPGGLGVHIIREVMDSAEYSKRDGKGMRLVLEKHLGATPEQPDGA